MKAITFSLWGQDLKYLVGAVRNAELAPRIYPGWTPIFYVGTSVPGACIAEIKQTNPDAIVKKMGVPGDWRAMFWRFAAAADPEVEAMISRDCDSRLCEREAAAVDVWMSMKHGFHRMFDHPWHVGVEILGGMWGVKGGVLPFMNEKMAAWQQEDRWQTDQEFLTQEIWPMVGGTCMTHDGLGIMGFPFPTPRVGDKFVGATIDEDENMVAEQVQMLRRYERR